VTEVRAPTDETYLGWIGGDPEGVFYYRVHSPVILIEFEQHGVMFDNDEPTRRHIHTVVPVVAVGLVGGDPAERDSGRDGGQQRSANVVYPGQRGRPGLFSPNTPKASQ
jgi:hypothetical protein